MVLPEVERAQTSYPNDYHIKLPDMDTKCIGFHYKWQVITIVWLKKQKKICDLNQRVDSKPALAITRKTRQNCDICAVHGECAGNGV